MKKFLSLLLAMTMTACAFTSCGDKDDDKDSGKGASASDEAKASKKEKNAAIGKWQPDDVKEIVFDIQSNDKAVISMVQDMSSIIYFDENKSFIFSGMEFSEDDYDFDGETFVLHSMSDNDLTMTKTDGSDDLFGEYKWISGDAYDAVARGYDNKAAENNSDESFSDSGTDIFMTCAEGSTSLEARINVQDFKLTKDTISIDGEFFGDEALLDAPYTVDGDTMTITNADGEDVKLTRIN